VSQRVELLVLDADGRTAPFEALVEHVILIGYSGRDRNAVEAHIRELEALGVAPPARVPAIYTVAPDLLTTSSRLVVNGDQTSGEAEFVLFPTEKGVLVGVGSDHTDRLREAADVAESKALCGKVISQQVWPLDALFAHWDRLELRAWTTDGSGRRLYQEGRLESLLQPDALLREIQNAGLTAANAVIFSGTLPTIGGFAYGNYFEVELSDPVLHRDLRCAYELVVAHA
jgi:hypothetical protein